MVLLKVEPAWSPSQGAPGIRHYKVGAISLKTTSMVNSLKSCEFKKKLNKNPTLKKKPRFFQTTVQPTVHAT